ncbi:mannose-specific lectin-like [Dendrobium catenatum]|uniref:mannose-specific lectin-like n=1 Tax=Dendrobium catenatum TaxID=906689 RepID=UPI0009F4F990|nr:mannose-specific lectin-like [Dendrobium catenatum]
MIKVLLLCTTSLSLLFTTPGSGQYSNYLLSGERLDTDRYLTKMVYKFIMQNDCNLVLYQLTNLIWSSGSGFYLTFERDGNLIIHNNENEIIWETEAIRSEGKYILILQRGGIVAAYGPSVWSTETNGYGSDEVVVAIALNGTMGVSGGEQNNVRETGKIMEVI